MMTDENCQRLTEEFAQELYGIAPPLSDEQKQQIIDLLAKTYNNILSHEQPIRSCNITQACDILHISQPTFRKYIRMGLLPEGRKVRGYAEILWEREDIIAFSKDLTHRK